MATISITSNDGALQSSSAVLEVAATNPEYNQPVLRIRQAGGRGGAASIRIDDPNPDIEFVETGLGGTIPTPASSRLPFRRTNSRSMAAKPIIAASKSLPCSSGRERASAFDGSNKCNVFDLDLAWRSGFRVPLLNIGTAAVPRYSYPRANSLTTYAAGALRGGNTALLGSDGTQWGWVATQTPAAQTLAATAAQPLEVRKLAGFERYTMRRRRPRHD